MESIAAVGLDLAKQVFQVCAIDNDGATLFNRKLRRSEILHFFRKLTPCLVGIEACAGSNFWAREIIGLGHRVRIIPAQYVKPFVMRDKTDANDARAICEALRQPDIRSVPSKSPDQQGLIISVRARQLLVRQRAHLVTALKYHFAELGIVVPAGRLSVGTLAGLLKGDEEQRIPKSASHALTALVEQIDDASSRIEKLDKDILEASKSDEEIQRLMSIPGVGITTATTIRAFVTDPGRFKSSRHFASWVGLVPREHSSGGKTRRGGISKRGNPTLRSLLFVGASAVVRHHKEKIGAVGWLRSLPKKRPHKVVCIALANKMARIVWALLTKGGNFRHEINFASDAT